MSFVGHPTPKKNPPHVDSMSCTVTAGRALIARLSRPAIKLLWGPHWLPGGFGHPEGGRREQMRTENVKAFGADAADGGGKRASSSQSCAGVSGWWRAPKWLFQPLASTRLGNRDNIHLGQAAEDSAAWDGVMPWRRGGDPGASRPPRVLPAQWANKPLPGCGDAAAREAKSHSMPRRERL